MLPERTTLEPLSPTKQKASSAMKYKKTMAY